jgi:hypothetical protein
MRMYSSTSFAALVMLAAGRVLAGDCPGPGCPLPQGAVVQPPTQQQFIEPKAAAAGDCPGPGCPKPVAPSKKDVVRPATGQQQQFTHPNEPPPARPSDDRGVGNEGPEGSP